MRNLGTRFNESNVFEVHGSDLDELKHARAILHVALQAIPGLLTPSEERIIAAFTTWYHSIDAERPYCCKNPAYAYMNMNTGVNLLFLISIPYEGCRGGNLALNVCANPVLQSEVFD